MKSKEPKWGRTGRVVLDYSIVFTLGTQPFLGHWSFSVYIELLSW